MNCKLIFVIFLTLSSGPIVQTLDEELFKDIKCIAPHPPVARNVDYRWLLSINRFYIPIQSKLNYYRMVSSLLETPISGIQESDLNSTCITYKWGDPSPKLFGFDNKTVTFVTTPIYENSFGFRGTWANDKRARAYMTFKKDENFIFFTNCWEDDQASWAVISSSKSLDPLAIEAVLNHAKSLGFNEEYIFNQTYEGCPENFDNLLSHNVKNEL